MRNVLLVCTMLLSLSAAKAQTTLPNTDFENWTISSYDEPTTYWSTSNSENDPEFNVSKVSGYMSNNAIRLETVDNGFDTLYAFITNTDGDPEMGEGGQPYSDSATGIRGFFRSNIATDDTALLIVMFKKNGVVISSDIFKFEGVQSTFTSFNFPISLPAVPDSVIIAAASSNIIDWTGVQGGSWIEFDSLEFTGTGTMAPIANGNFENWTQIPVHDLNGWQAEGNVKRSTDKYSGTYAAQLTTTEDSEGEINYAQLFNGIQYSGTIDTLTGWYKYATNTSGSDSAIILVSYVDGSGTPVHTEFHAVGSTSAYTQFSIPLDDQGNGAEYVAIGFLSSGFFGIPEVGSVLLVDKLEIKEQNVGVKNTIAKLANVNAYPNPAKDVLNLSVKTNAKEDVSVTVFDIKGSVLYKNTFNTNGNEVITVPVKELNKGVYFFNVKTSEGLATGKFIKE